MTLDQARLDAFVGRMLGELGAASIVPLVRIGDELGLYAALRDAGPVTAAVLARAHPGPTSAAFASGSRPTPPPATSTTIRSATASR